MENIILPHDHGNLPKELQNWMPKEPAFVIISDVLKVISDARRVRLFWILCHCEECVMNLSALMKTSSSVVSHHLKLLKAAGFVVSRREGKEVYYTAADTERTRILHEMIEQVAELSCPAEETSLKQQSYDTNIKTITEIHDFLLQNIRTRYTIFELSQKFLINQTTLKTTFKKVYGKPVATYMKERRMYLAKELLCADYTVAEVAAKVGYENQGKFTEAFKEVTGLLPKEFRKHV